MDLHCDEASGTKRREELKGYVYNVHGPGSHARGTSTAKGRKYAKTLKHGCGFSHSCVSHLTLRIITCVTNFHFNSC